MRIGVAKPQSEAHDSNRRNSLEVMNRGAAAQRFRSTIIERHRMLLLIETHCYS